MSLMRRTHAICHDCKVICFSAGTHFPHKHNFSSLKCGNPIHHKFTVIYLYLIYHYLYSYLLVFWWHSVSPIRIRSSSWYEVFQHRVVWAEVPVEKTITSKLHLEGTEPSWKLKAFKNGKEFTVPRHILAKEIKSQL